MPWPTYKLSDHRLAQLKLNPFNCSRLCSRGKGQLDICIKCNSCRRSIMLDSHDTPWDYTKVRDEEEHTKHERIREAIIWDELDTVIEMLETYDINDFEQSPPDGTCSVACLPLLVVAALHYKFYTIILLIAKGASPGNKGSRSGDCNALETAVRNEFDTEFGDPTAGVVNPRKIEQNPPSKEAVLAVVSLLLYYNADVNCLPSPLIEYVENEDPELADILENPKTFVCLQEIMDRFDMDYLDERLFVLEAEFGDNFYETE
jgi:hypothetical protein